MFSKDKRNKRLLQNSNKKEIPSIIANNLYISGNMISEGEIHIDGNVDGDIRSHILLVGETAQVRGELIADSIVVHGTVQGHIKAREVILARTARMTGDIIHESLTIEPGAFLEGHCRHISCEAEVLPTMEKKKHAESLSTSSRIVGIETTDLPENNVNNLRDDCVEITGS